MKHIAVFSYHRSNLGNNLGDDIQSIAAERLLPYVSTYIERDRMKETCPKEDCLLIANGWYLHRLEHFELPPNVKPLFIGVHIAHAALMGQPYIEQFRQHSPIGCRDEVTLSLFKEQGIDAYYSSCPTLTLPRYTGPRSQMVYLVEPPKNLKIPDHLLKYSENIWHMCYPHLYTDRDVRRTHVLALLERYRKARLVITSRLHCVLPCIAYGTPVIFVHLEPSGRTAVVNKMIKTYSMDQLDKIDWDPPPPEDQLALRELITTKVQEAVDAFLKE